MKTIHTDKKNEGGPEKFGNRNRILTAILIALAFCTAVLVFVIHREHHETALQDIKVQPRADSTPPPKPIGKVAVTPVPPQPLAPESNTPVPEVKEAVVQKAAPKAKGQTDMAAPVEQPPTVEHKPVKDPAARVALTLVGLDSDAEDYWLAAIQDTTLPTSERQDLIDDLNEEGLPDPKHPTQDDLPLILSRLEILEEIAPSLPEELDWKEAYSDLVNLVDVANGGGKPVN